MNAFLRICAVASIAFAAACGEEAEKTEADGAAQAVSSKQESAWRSASQANTKPAFTAFINAYPQSARVQEALARRRILDIEPIGLNVKVAAPEGVYMVSAPPELQSDGTIAPSRAIAAVPAGTTLNLNFSATIDGEEVQEVLTATFDAMDGDRMIFRNEGGDCIWHDAATGRLGYCEGEAPPPPDPADIRALMAYAWLVVARDR